MKPDREASIARRLAMRPAIEYDESLPVNERRGEIARVIAEHQVVIVCGETGSGKTTQLPKICLELGRGCAGLIGHTQPRRIAARATAARIAQELNSEPGRYVGYKIRFTDRVTPETYIKLMTDGILLAETQGDPQLRAYDTIILDEAHERSLNIDFLLGFLKQLLPRRPDLKVIVTSATLDAEKFSRHFGNAPVIEVSGRLYPIETRWRPVQDETTEKDRQIHDAIVDAVDEAQRAGPGDVLVFLPGEREIREAAEALRKHAFTRTGGPATEILPLFARQSAQEQSRVFQAHQGRRVVLATNVAETSLTVPGIRYVVDTGLARLKRYSHRNKIEQLQVEPIAQAAANQRAGRCGRVAAGICFRLYAEDDFAKRPPYTDPEIMRSSLAGVILRMKALHLGDVEDFPFLQPPQSKMVSAGYQLLGELGAVDEGRELTPLGLELAKLPLDPKIGRMILAARDEGTLTELLVIAAALSVPDPRERPPERSGSANQAHAKWKDEKSEFISYLKLWHAADEAWKHESSSKLKLWCRQNFISWMRLREWRDIHGQLHALCTEHGWKITSALPPSPLHKEGGDVGSSPDGGSASHNGPALYPLGHKGRPGGRAAPSPAAYDAIHRALLSGLLGNVGLKSEDEGHYLGAHGIKFYIHPGSTLIKKAGRWIMAAELMETSRLFARCVARIEPEWLETVGAHLVKRHVYEPHWEKSSGQVVAWERATLHGLLLYAKRRVQFGRPGADRVSASEIELARELFIRGALVNGEVHEDYARRAKFFQHNRKLIADIEALEHKSRRPDVLVDEELIHAFYDSKLPEEVVSLAAFDAWRKEAEARQPKLLFLERDQLMRHEAAGITTDAFPHSMAFHGQHLPLSYHHDPGAADDGVTLSLPLPALNQVSAHRCDWLVPGLLKEKTLALLKTLPQRYRQRLQPLDAFVERFCAAAHDLEEAPVRALTRAVEETLAMKLPLDAFRPGELRPHLMMNFRLLDEHGGTLAMSRSLPDLRAEHGGRVASAFADVRLASPAGGADQGGQAGLTAWTFGDLPELMEVELTGQQGRIKMIGFPALVDEGDSVALRVFDTPDQARAQHRRGLRRLFALGLREQVKTIEKSLPGARELALQFIHLGSEKDLREQLVVATLERTCLVDPLPLSAQAFEARKESARTKVILVAQEFVRLLTTLLAEYTVLQKKIVSMQKAFPHACADITTQMAELLNKEFILATPFERLAHFPRYLKAAIMRLDKLRADADRDARLMREWQSLGKSAERERDLQARSGVADPFLEEFRWLLEELRVALFAQELRTPTPVSVKRLQKMWEARARK